MTAREHLEQALTTEKAGSPVIKALSDMVSLQYVEGCLAAAGKDVQYEEILKMLLERATIIETVRKRRFGKQGGRYNKAWDDFEEYVQPYYENSGEVHPAKVIFEDLQEINNGKMGR